MTNTRNRALDMLKIFATIFILFHHYQQMCEVVTGLDFSGGFWHGSFYWGYMVELFFLISGYCMLSYVPKIQEGLTFYRFYGRRAARLLPLMALSGVVSTVLILLYQKMTGSMFLDAQPSLFGMFLQALGIQAGWGFTNPMLNNPTWYCSVLLLCYIVFYGIVFWSHRLKISPVFGFVFFALLGCGIQNYGLDLPFMNSSTCRGFYAFFAGLLLALLMPVLQKCRWAFWFSAVAVILFALEFWQKGGQVGYMPHVLVFIVYPAIVLLLQSKPFGWFSSLPLWEKWDKICYSVFIWHGVMYLLVFLVLESFHMDKSVMVNRRMMILCAAVLQLIGVSSYYFIENPLNQKMLSWLASLDPMSKAEKS